QREAIPVAVAIGLRARFRSECGLDFCINLVGRLSEAGDAYQYKGEQNSHGQSPVAARVSGQTAPGR
ncbi:MAG: hypothetical protein OEM76_14150, partial [Gammaproteobacteria bacterium]|nr:hypothetical protein [Gammaproteobacteria bacterium]